MIYTIADDHEFLEVQRQYARNIIIGFARFNGLSVGIVANQPNFFAGVLDISASRKAARFVRSCDAFNLKNNPVSKQLIHCREWKMN